MSYTKGPFRISGPSSGLGSCDDGGDYAIIDKDNVVIGEAIYRVSGDTYGYRDAEANARLWASAPDLLAERDALREALERMVKVYEVHFKPLPPQWQADSAYTQARAALAAAEEAA